MEIIKKNIIINHQSVAKCGKGGLNIIPSLTWSKLLRLGLHLEHHFKYSRKKGEMFSMGVQVHGYVHNESFGENSIDNVKGWFKKYGTSSDV